MQALLFATSLVLASTAFGSEPPASAETAVSSSTTGGFDAAPAATPSSPAVSVVNTPLPSPFAHPLLGQCFTTAQDAVKALGGDGSDENIIANKDTRVPGWTWVVDNTPSHNFMWSLVESDARSRRHCVALFIPYACCVDSRISGGIASVLAQTQASPGFPSYDMEFRRSPRLGHFVPFACHATTWPMEGGANATPVQENIDCLHVGD